MHGKRHYACSTAATTAAQLPSRGKGGGAESFSQGNCVLAYVSDVFGCPEGSKRSKSLKWRRWSSFRSKITQAALWHTCPTFFGVFGAPKRVWALETRFRASFSLRRPETIKKRRTRMKKKRCCQDWARLALLELQKRTWRPMEPGWLAGRPAGWLAG